MRGVLRDFPTSLPRSRSLSYPEWISDLAGPVRPPDR
jgi:hypothetical protein